MSRSRRKKKWKHAEKLARNAVNSPVVKGGASALAGLVTLTATSAIVSSVRRKGQS